jgi:hypothetical protein
VGGIIKHAFDMGSGANIYIPSFIKIDSGIQKLMGAERTHRQHGDLISILLGFFQNNERRLKNRLKVIAHTFPYTNDLDYIGTKSTVAGQVKLVLEYRTTMNAVGR